MQDEGGGLGWQKMRDEGVRATIEELATRQKVNPCYMSRVLRLTPLAPDFVEAVLDGQHASGMRVLTGWDEQHGNSIAQ